MRQIQLSLVGKTERPRDIFFPVGFAPSGDGEGATCDVRRVDLLSLLVFGFREFRRALRVPRACLEVTIWSEYLIPDSYTSLDP